MYKLIQGKLKSLKPVKNIVAEISGEDCIHVSVSCKKYRDLVNTISHEDWAKGEMYGLLDDEIIAENKLKGTIFINHCYDINKIKALIESLEGAK